MATCSCVAFASQQRKMAGADWGPRENCLPQDVARLQSSVRAAVLLGRFPFLFARKEAERNDLMASPSLTMHNDRLHTFLIHPGNKNKIQLVINNQPTNL